MDNLKLVEHFETLKKFLLMEDGEFSYSLTQQLFEKVQITGVPIQNDDNISFSKLDGSCKRRVPFTESATAYLRNERQQTNLLHTIFFQISSGVAPQQLCCISTLNCIMAQSIQSSVYACQSENTRSLSFVLKSIPDIFKRNGAKYLRIF